MYMNSFDLELNEENLQKTITRNTLNRNKKIVMLAKMLLNQKNNIAISIDGSWGSGKTFFVKQFEYVIKNIEKFFDDKSFQDEEKKIFTRLNEKHIIIYYNAWENDDHDNPLESILYNILNDFPEQKNSLIDFDELKKALKYICFDGIKVVSKNLLDPNYFDKMKSFKELTSEIITIEEKKKAFNKLIDNILYDNQRLILIIDELDRCNPNFAVKLLETIKHFYNNKKITILFSTNNNQLSHTIKKFYGDNFDGYSYLNKFYDAIITLECEDINNYLQDELQFNKSVFLSQDISSLLLKYYGFSLRECNRFVSLYNLLSNYIESETYFDREENCIVSAILLPFAIALKIKNINKYYDFMHKNSQMEILEFLTKEVDGTDSENWLRALTENKGSDYKQIIINYYEKMISGNRGIHVTPFFEAISMLGTRIQIENIDHDN